MSALERYNRAMEGELEGQPVERLRFFLSLALTGQDWLDVEQFIDGISQELVTRADLVEARIRKAVEAECAAKQAKIDMLMLEYCPDEMTKEQIDEWARNQNTVDGSNKRLCGERK